MNINSYRAVDLAVHFPKGWIPENLRKAIVGTGQPQKFDEQRQNELLRIGCNNVFGEISVNFKIKYFNPPEFGLAMLNIYWLSCLEEHISNFSFGYLSVESRNRLKGYMRPRASCEVFHIIYKYAQKYQYHVLVELLHYLKNFDRMPYVDVNKCNGKAIIYKAMRYGIGPILECWMDILFEGDDFALYNKVSIIRAACECSAEYSKP